MKQYLNLTNSSAVQKGYHYLLDNCRIEVSYHAQSRFVQRFNFPSPAKPSQLITKWLRRSTLNRIYINQDNEMIFNILYNDWIFIVNCKAQYGKVRLIVVTCLRTPRSKERFSVRYRQTRAFSKRSWRRNAVML